MNRILILTVLLAVVAVNTSASPVDVGTTLASPVDVDNTLASPVEKETVPASPVGEGYLQRAQSYIPSAYLPSLPSLPSVPGVGRRWSWSAGDTVKNDKNGEARKAAAAKITEGVFALARTMGGAPHVKALLEKYPLAGKGINFGLSQVGLYQNTETDATKDLESTEKQAPNTSEPLAKISEGVYELMNTMSADDIESTLKDHPLLARVLDHGLGFLGVPLDTQGILGLRKAKTARDVLHIITKTDNDKDAFIKVALIAAGITEPKQVMIRNIIKLYGSPTMREQLPLLMRYISGETEDLKEVTTSIPSVLGAQ